MFSRPRSASTAPARPRDLPYGDEPLAVRWRKGQYRCLAGSPVQSILILSVAPTTDSSAEFPSLASPPGRCAGKRT